MHLCRQRAGDGAGGGIVGPQPGGGKPVGQFLGDGEALGDDGAVVQPQGRYGPGRGEIRQHLLEGGRVERREPQGEGKVETVDQQAEAQGPAGIGAVAEGEFNVMARP